MEIPPKVDEINYEPEVGKLYLVPCIEVKKQTLFGQEIDRKFWAPTKGKWHDDAEIIGFPDRHIHYDFRFVNIDRVYSFLYASYSTEILENRREEIFSTIMGKILTVNDSINESFIHQPLRCVREMPNFPKMILDYGGNPKAEIHFLRALEEAYKDKKMECLTCPHRGNNLNGLPSKDGVVVCDNHGLAWNVNTGNLVSRFK